MELTPDSSDALHSGVIPSIYFDNMGEAGPRHRGHLWSASGSFPEDTNTELVKWRAVRPEGGTRKEIREEAASLLKEKLTLFQSQG